MIRKLSSVIIALALFAVAGMSLAQNADKNSAGPTKNDLQIRIIEPLEGATITGTTARVAVDYDRSRYREQGNLDKGLDKFPPPTFTVFLDNDLKQTLKPGDTVATIDNIQPGSHRIVIMAKNISGEVVDRKQINITAVTAPAVASSSSSTTERTRAEMPVSAPAPATSYQSAPAPAPVETATTLPKTASSSPQLALLGLALVAGGILVGRKGR